MSGFNQLREECKDEVVATLRDLRQVSNPWRLHGSVEQQPANLGVSLLNRSLEPVDAAAFDSWLARLADEAGTEWPKRIIDDERPT